MIDRLRVVESDMPDNTVDCRGEVPLTVVKRLRSSLPPTLRVVLPEEASSEPMQPPPLTNLCQQMLQLASSQSDGSQILADLAACIGNAFDVDGCAIALPSSVDTNTQVVYWFADAPPQVRQLKTTPAFFDGWHFDSLAISIDPVETVPAHHATALSARKFLALWQPIASLRASSLPIVALLGTTTHVQGRVNGAISLMRSRPHTWTQAEIAGLQTVSHQVASTIDQVRLQHQLSQQRQHQQVVNQLTLAIHNASDLSTILKLATDGTAQALQVQRGMLLRLKHWDTLFRNRASTQIPKIRVNVACEWLSADADRESLHDHHEPITDQRLTTGTNQSFWLSECTLCQQAFLHPDSPIMLAGGQLTQSKLDVATSNHLDSSIATTFNVESLPTLLLAPLESQGIVLGFLVFQQDQPRFWQPEELALVQLVSAQVSTAIIQTETLRQVQSLVEKRTAELRESLSVQAKLYDRTRYQLDQLRHLNQAKDDFLSTVSHELRTPLTSMTMAICMLRQVGLSGERSARYLDILEQQCAQETNLINDLLGLQELELNQVAVNLQEIDLKALMRDLIRQFQQKWSAKGVTIETKLPKRSLRLLSDRDSLHRILFELLTNAGKYSHPNSCVQLHVAQKKDPDSNQIIVTLNNVGQGIAPDELPLIFDKFKRCQGATQNAVQGTGLGLALVKSLVQHLNGDITASSHATEDAHTYETCFTLTLPQTFAYQELR
ncbi:MAG: GAF domain-containing protein [Tildeniella nuda ZEHNDER 1965/U140]|jgi:signal transduction histidine kinase|nr:GAF domain-containing protein [Tildeniella nuda ZEHNDER 1965/U140]